MPRGKIKDAVTTLVTELAQEEAEKQIERRPGAIIRGNKIAWTKRDLSQFKMVSLTPSDTVPLTWNGIQYYLEADATVEVPEPVAVQYKQWREQNKRAGMPPPGIQFSPGAGALPVA